MDRCRGRAGTTGLPGLFSTLRGRERRGRKSDRFRASRDYRTTRTILDPAGAGDGLHAAIVSRRCGSSRFRFLLAVLPAERSVRTTGLPGLNLTPPRATIPDEICACSMQSYENDRIQKFFRLRTSPVSLDSCGCAPEAIRTPLFNEPLRSRDVDACRVTRAWWGGGP